MAALASMLRAELLEISQTLVNASTGTGDVDVSLAKTQLETASAAITLLAKNVQGLLDQASGCIDPTDSSSSSSALSFVTRAARVLAPTPALVAQAPLSPPTRTFPLPTELIAHALSFIHPLTEYKERQRSNMSMALVSRAFYRAAKVHLDHELAITDARQFKGLASKLQDNPTIFDGVKILTLDFNFVALRTTMADHPQGRSWLALPVYDVLSRLTRQDILTLGPTLVRTWYADGIEGESTFQHFFLHRTGVFPPAPRLLRCHALDNGFCGIGDALLNMYWSGTERVEIVTEGEPTEAWDRLPAIQRSYAWRSFDAPHLVITLRQLLHFFSTESRLEHLSFTLFVALNTDVNVFLFELNTFFARLAPTIKSLHIRCNSGGNPRHNDIANHIFSLIPTLPYLTSLGIGGDVPLGNSFQSRIEDGIAPILAPLPLVDLHFFLSIRPLFHIDDDQPDDLETLLTGRQGGDPTFAKLQRLTIDYSDEKRVYIPIHLAVVCRKRGIELNLCKAV